MDLDDIDDMLDALEQTRAEGEDDRLDRAAVEGWFATHGEELLAEIVTLRADLAAARAEVERLRAFAASVIEIDENQLARSASAGDVACEWYSVVKMARTALIRRPVEEHSR